VTDSAQLRERAQEILSQQRFHARKSPAPFRGVFRWLGDRLAPVLDPVQRFFARLFENTAAQVTLVIIVVLVVVVISRLAIRRRAATALGDGGRRARRGRDDPAALEREAERAEADGDFEHAIRLRFRAGVLRLQLAGRVQRGDTTATRAIGRQLNSHLFDAIGDTFDAVAYGGNPATERDARSTRESWTRVLSESSS
jgi:hypothetical protein